MRNHLSRDPERYVYSKIDFLPPFYFKSVLFISRLYFGPKDFNFDDSTEFDFSNFDSWNASPEVSLMIIVNN